MGWFLSVYPWRLPTGHSLRPARGPKERYCRVPRRFRQRGDQLRRVGTRSENRQRLGSGAAHGWARGFKQRGQRVAVRLVSAKRQRPNGGAQGLCISTGKPRAKLARVQIPDPHNPQERCDRPRPRAGTDCASPPRCRWTSTRCRHSSWLRRTRSPHARASTQSAASPKSNGRCACARLAGCSSPRLRCSSGQERISLSLRIARTKPVT